MSRSFDEIYHCPGRFRALPKVSAHHLAAGAKLRLPCVCRPDDAQEDTAIASH